MEYRIIVGQRARNDAEGIVSFIAGHSHAAACNWYEELMVHMVGLSRMPRRHAVAFDPELNDLGIRQMVFGNYRVLFAVDDHSKTVQVLHIRHGARRSASVDDVLFDDGV
ncbi:MAG: type II toxin-antitoxin system RelE/ParE family toxin [bacterium]|nr:type II toxin-antitoxin system RelE/ParE family toxin [bacterium]